MENIMLNGESIEISPDGQLKSLGDWNEKVARALAQREGLTLTEAHWEIIDLIRNYYKQYNISPILKLLKKEIRHSLEPSKASDEYLNTLFPLGVISQGTRIAGLPKPLLDAELENTIYMQTRPYKSDIKLFSEFEFEGKNYQVYPNGNLVYLEDWSEKLAEHMAQCEGIELTEAHWEILHFLRQFYFQYGIAPMVRLLMKHMKVQMGEEKSSEEYLYKLFPGGPSRQGSRIAGLPEPQGCIDS